MVRKTDKVFNPLDMPKKLRQMGITAFFGFGLLIFAVVLATIVNVQHTSAVVGKSNSLLSRGDCRSSATADLWSHRAEYDTNLADLLLHAATPQGSPDRLKIPVDAAGMKLQADQITAAAQRYNDCAKPKLAITTTS